MGKQHKTDSSSQTTPSIGQRIQAWESTSLSSNSDHLSEVRLGGDESTTPTLDSVGQAKNHGGYDAAKGEWTGKRPSKPSALSGKDEVGDDLTAHHLYPWNEIRDDLNGALGSKDRPAMERLLQFGQVTADNAFWDDFVKEPKDRSPDFAITLVEKMRSICWSPSNVFMGPLGNKRAEDPGEDLDATYARSGLPTPSSALAEMLHKNGGIGKAQSPLLERFMQNTLEANGGQARPYDPREWDTKTVMKKKGPKTGLVQRRQIPLNASEDADFDPTRTVSNAAPVTLSKEDRRARDRQEGLARQALKQQQSAQSNDDDLFGGMGGLFGMDDDEVAVDDDLFGGMGGLFGEDEEEVVAAVDEGGLLGGLFDEQ